MIMEGHAKLVATGVGLMLVGPAVVRSLGRISYVIAKEVVKGGIFTYAVVAGGVDAVVEHAENLLEEAEAELEGREPHYREVPKDEEAVLEKAERVVEHEAVNVVETLIMGVL